MAIIKRNVKFLAKYTWTFVCCFIVIWLLHTGQESGYIDTRGAVLGEKIQEITPYVRQSLTTTFSTTFTTSKQRPTIEKRKKVKPQKQLSKVSFGTKISYPLDIDMREIVKKKLANETIDVAKINLHAYNYLHNPSFQCQRQSAGSPFAIILVKSKIDNFELRAAIRVTWGNITKYREKVSLVFLLGDSKLLREKVDEESKKYQDIVNENFEDKYWNNTLKTIMGFTWAVTYCQQSSYLFFVDDDYFVHVGSLLDYLYRQKGKELFTGFALTRSQPFRNKGGKWYVSVEDYPYHYYPPYLAGGAYLVSMSVAQMFHIVFPYVKYFVIDDVYLGIVAQKLNIKPKHEGKFVYSKNLRITSSREFIACHGSNDVKKLLQDWRQLTYYRLAQLYGGH